MLADQNAQVVGAHLLERDQPQLGSSTHPLGGSKVGRSPNGPPALQLGERLQARVPGSVSYEYESKLAWTIRSSRKRLHERRSLEMRPAGSGRASVASLQTSTPLAAFDVPPPASE